MPQDFGEVVDKLEANAKKSSKKVSLNFLYTVERRDTIPNDWSKRLPSFKANEVPITSYYKYEKERWGEVGNAQ